MTLRGLTAWPALLAAVAVAAGALPRVLLAADALPEVLHPFVWSDVLFTWERGLSGGRLPYWDAFFEYPPLIGYVAGAFSRVTGPAVAYVALWAVVQIGAAAFVGGLLAQMAPQRRALAAWALAPQLVLFGPLNFDLLPVAAAVLAIRWERTHAMFHATTAVAVGSAAKLFPAAMLPVVLLRMLVRSGARSAALGALLFVALVGVAYVPSAFAPFPSAQGLSRYAVGIAANFDSVWGIMASLLVAVRIEPATPILVLTLGGLAATYLLAVIPASTRARDGAAPIALAVVTLLLWSRVYSPQYSLWALPFFALLPLPGRALATLTAADVVVFLTVYPLTLRPWPADDPVRAVLLGALAVAVVIRHVALVATWMAARRLCR